MRKNLLLMLVAFFLPCLAAAENMAVQKTIPSNYYSYEDYRMVVPVGTAGITLPQTADHQDSYAVAQWIKINSIYNGQGGVLMDFGTYEHLNKNGNWNLSCTQSGGLVLNGHGADVGGIGGNSTTSATVTLSDWHYILYQYDAATQTFELYVDGEKAWDKALGYNAYYQWADGEFHFGGFGLAAYIDEVHVFNKALSADEVAQAYKDPKSIASLTGFYTFDEQTGDGGFANLATNAPESTDATWTRYKGSAFWGDGVVNNGSYSNTPAQATLVEGREITQAPTTVAFTVPANDGLPGITKCDFSYTQTEPQKIVTMLAGETYQLAPGTEIIIMLDLAEGSTVTDLEINGTALNLKSAMNGTKLYGYYTTTEEPVTLESYKSVGYTEPDPTPDFYSFELPDPATIDGVSKIQFMDYDENNYLPGTVYQLAPETGMLFQIFYEEGYTINGLKINGEDVEIAKSGKYYYGAYEVNANVTPESFEFDITAPEPSTDVDYCEYVGTTTSNRGVSSLTVNGVTVEGNGTSGARNVFKDQTSTVVNVQAGETLTITSSGAGEWMHTFIYIDFDNDGWTVDPEATTPNGDLVWYQQLCPKSLLKPMDSSINNERFYDMNGTQVGESNYTIGGVNASINIPAELATGDYRVRYKVDWAASDPCSNDVQSIATNGGSMIDFTLHVENSLGAIGDIAADATDAAAEYFTLHGRRVAAGNLTPGFYIVRKGSTVAKVFVGK